MQIGFLQKETQADDKTVLYGLKYVFPSHTSEAEDWEIREAVETNARGMGNVETCAERYQGNGKCGMLCRKMSGEWGV